MEKIKFWKFDQQFGQFGNYWSKSNDPSFRLVIDSLEWNSSEHYFQAQKFLYPGCSKENEEYAELIRKVEDPHAAKVMGNQDSTSMNLLWRDNINALILEHKSIGVMVNPEWNSVKEDVMRKVLYEKFRQNSHLRKVLLDTKSLPLVEQSPRDNYWGVGSMGTGENRLGSLLEEVRSQIREENLS